MRIRRGLPRAIARQRLLGRVAPALVTVAVSACAGAASAGVPTARVGPAVGDVAPAVDGTSLQGHHVSLSSSRGAVTVVLFWASWCSPCQAEQPGINSLAAEEAPHGVHFTGISVDNDTAAARAYLARYAVPYDSLIDDAQTQALTLAFAVSGPPETFVIDRHGHVAARIIGPADPAALRADIAAAGA